MKRIPLAFASAVAAAALFASTAGAADLDTNKGGYFGSYSPVLMMTAPDAVGNATLSNYIALDHCGTKVVDDVLAEADRSDGSMNFSQWTAARQFNGMWSEAGADGLIDASTAEYATATNRTGAHDSALHPIVANDAGEQATHSILQARAQTQYGPGAASLYYAVMAKMVDPGTPLIDGQMLFEIGAGGTFTLPTAQDWVDGKAHNPVGGIDGGNGQQKVAEKENPPHWAPHSGSGAILQSLVDSGSIHVKGDIELATLDLIYYRPLSGSGPQSGFGMLSAGA